MKFLFNIDLRYQIIKVQVMIVVIWQHQQRLTARIQLWWNPFF